MKRKITISWSLFNLLSFGIFPLWWWRAECNNLDGTKSKAGYYIYGVCLKFLGFEICAGVATFKKELRVSKSIIFSKILEFGKM